MDSGMLRVARGGCGAKAPPLAARPGKLHLKISLYIRPRKARNGTRAKCGLFETSLFVCLFVCCVTWVIKSRSCFRHLPQSHMEVVLWNS